MAESLLLPVTFNGQEFFFNMEMIAWTYTHRFRVDVFGDVYHFEPDEEGEYRAIADATASITKERSGLLKEIGATLSTLMQQ
jgi:hypothetical protein